MRHFQSNIWVVFDRASKTVEKRIEEAKEAEAKAATDQMMAVLEAIKEESQSTSTNQKSLKQRVDHTLDIVTDLRYKVK